MNGSPSGARRIVVAGASGLLGRAVVNRLAAADVQPIGIDLASQGPAGIPFFGGVDLADEQAVARIFEQIGNDGDIHGLVNVAGGFVWQTVEESCAESWQNMFRINVLSAVNASRSALSLLRSGGSIVNVGAAAAANAASGMAVYTAAKSGVARLTEALAAECKERGIRVNAVLPSILDTPQNRKDMGDADSHKWVRPAELAEVIAFLLSDGASAITGATIPVTGRL